MVSVQGRAFPVRAHRPPPPSLSHRPAACRACLAQVKEHHLEDLLQMSKTYIHTDKQRWWGPWLLAARVTKQACSCKPSCRYVAKLLKREQEKLLESTRAAGLKDGEQPQAKRSSLYSKVR